MPDKLLTIDEVADYLSLSVTTLRSKAFRQRVGLSAIRIGKNIRFSKQTLSHFITRNTEYPDDANAED